MTSPSPLPVSPNNNKHHQGPLTGAPTSNSPDPAGALLHYLRALAQGRLPSKAALISSMKSCSLLPAIQEGKSIHAHAFKSGLADDRFVASSLIVFYSSCSHLGSARQVFDGIPVKDTALQTAMLMGYLDNADAAQARKFFDEMSVRDVVTWNVMLGGYNRHGLPEEALELFRIMQISMVRPSEVTLICALSACSQMGSLALGQWIHGYIHRHIKTGGGTTLINSLVHMYARCGRLDVALGLFMDQSPKNLESWNTMLTALALHGCGMGALALFSQMIKLGIGPDRISFLAILMACSHTGKVDNAHSCFRFVTRVHGVEPRAEHYGCLVDVLARSGRLEEAQELIGRMPFKPDAHVWGGLLGGCFIHGDYELGLVAASRLVELEPGEEGRYIALLNLYARVGRREEAMIMRKLIEPVCTKRLPGRSTLEFDGGVHEFVASG